MIKSISTLIFLVVFTLPIVAQNQGNNSGVQSVSSPDPCSDPVVVYQPVPDSLKAPYVKSRFNSWSLYFGAGNIFTTGDLYSKGAENTSFDIGYHLGISKMINSSIGFELQAVFGNSTMYPNDFVSDHLNGYTETEFFQTTLLMPVNLSNLILTGRDFQRRWNVSFYPGIGLSYHKAYFHSDIDPEMDQDWSTNGSKEDQYTRLVHVPLALGIKYRLSGDFDLELRETYNMFSDDNFDGRVHETASDYMFYTSLSLVWKIGKKARSLEWSDPLDESFGKIEMLEKKVDNLTVDTDGDGVSDYFDQENNTPEGIAVSGNGKAMDTDNDNVPDYKDIEPYSPHGAIVDGNGRELDDDSDGIGNSVDKESDTKQGAMVNWQGVTIRNTGISDAFIPSVYFKRNSFNIDEDLYRDLSVVARIMMNNPGVRMKVVGFADYTGSAEYNQKISRRRAETVVNHLVNVYGIDESRFEVESHSNNLPLAKNKDFSSVNRRVDFQVID